MPASFAASLCGFRDGKPNTSDASDASSIELGFLFFEELGVPPGAIPPKNVGKAMADAVVADLSAHVGDHLNGASVRTECALDEFEQFTHLKAARELARDLNGDVVKTLTEIERHIATLGVPEPHRTRLDSLVEEALKEVARANARRRLLLNTLGEESILKLDVAVHRTSPYPGVLRKHLLAGFSLKWSLRTDRAQDCRSQGAKMAALRRGRMPHFAPIVMEPRPYFLAILGRGSGDVDCVYHLHLPALGRALKRACEVPTLNGRQKAARLEAYETFLRLCEQGRLRDYGDLIAYVSTL